MTKNCQTQCCLRRVENHEEELKHYCDANTTFAQLLQNISQASNNFIIIGIDLENFVTMHGSIIIIFRKLIPKNYDSMKNTIILHTFTRFAKQSKDNPYTYR